MRVPYCKQSSISRLGHDISTTQDAEELVHYQIRQPRGKLVRAVLGDVYDVVVDMRKGSSTFGRWTAHRLCAENRRTLWVPPGFAHGFYVISVFAEVVYKCTDFYSPEHERSLRWDDPTLGIDWPLVAGGQPRLSAKDAGAALFKDAEYFE